MTMEYKLEDIKNIGKKTAEIMRSNGIESVEDLACIDINELSKIRGISKLSGKKIIEQAKLILKSSKKDEKKVINQFEKQISENSSLIPSEHKTDPTDKKIHERKDEILDSKSINEYSKRDQITKRTVIQEKIDVTDHQESSNKKVRDFKEKFPRKSISKPEFKKIEKKYLENLFSDKRTHRIRFLYNRIKQIEQKVYNDYNNFVLNDLTLFLEYINILNINYNNRNHSLILKELNLTRPFYDPIAKKTIPIKDIMFECARVSWTLAKIYVILSEKFEKKENFENAILAMVKASQMYKTATFFSTSAVFQEEKGIIMEAENLELNSEECRILAQGLAALREEKNNNLLLASKLYAGLSTLSKRLFYLKEHEQKKKWQIEAKMNYDMGKSYQMRIIAILNNINHEEISESLESLEKLHIKAYYYFSKAQEIWEKMLRNLDDLLEREIKILKSNLSVVKKNIIETEVKNVDYNEIKFGQECEPIIIIPEIFSLIVPKSLTYLTKYSPKDINFKRLKKFRNLTFHDHHSLNKKQELQNIKSAIGRTIRQIKLLYDNDDIEVDKYVELLEKYNIKQKMIDGEIENLENLKKKQIKPKKT